MKKIVSCIFGVLLFVVFFGADTTLAANPSTPILASDNIQDPGSPSTPWGGCGPTDSNCYVTVVNSQWSTVASGISYDSNVGIGTTTPITQLHVAGKLPTGALGSITADKSVASLAVQGKYIYAVDYTLSFASNKKFYIIDVSNPASPTIISTTTTSGSPRAIEVRGSYAYVLNDGVNGTYELQVFDVANPASVALKGALDIGSGYYPQSLVVQGKYAFVSRVTDIKVIDISNPNSPTYINGPDPSINIAAMAPQGKYLYIVGRPDYSVYTGGQLKVLDMSNPGVTSPSVVGTVTTNDDPAGIFVQGRYAYVVNVRGNTMQIFDISTPTAPVVVGSIALAGTPNTATTSTLPSAVNLPYNKDVAGVYVQGRFAYVVNSLSNTIQVIDISIPALPTSVGTIPTAAVPISIVVQGRYAYVGSYTGRKMEVFDIGGAYLQQLEVGGTETGTLSVLRDAYVGNNLNVGSLSVERGANIRGALGVFGGVSTTVASFTVNTNGNVGVGNIAPALLLHVGSSSVTDGTAVLRLQDSNSTCDFNANTGSPSCGSDITLKKDVVSLNNDDLLAKVSALRPVSYKWLTDDADGPTQYGFIAQEVGEQFPNLVSDGQWVDGTTRKFLNMGGLMPYVVGAIKEMNIKINGIGDTATPNTLTANLIAWFGNINNNIEKLFVKEIYTEKLCIKSTCINEDELQRLLQANQIVPQQNAMPTVQPEQDVPAQENVVPIESTIPADNTSL